MSLGQLLNGRVNLPLVITDGFNWFAFTKPCSFKPWLPT